MDYKDKGQALLTAIKALGTDIEAINIVFIRDANRETWEPVPATPDLWNDVAVLVRNTGEVIGCYTCTCEPGKYYTQNPMNPDGAFRLAADYYHKEKWKLGQHFGRPALEQAASLFGYRDKNKNYTSEASEAVWIPEGSKVNIHNVGQRNGNGFDGGSTIEKWSAGCAVFRFNDAWNKFLGTVRGMGKKLYSATVIKSTTLKEYT